MTMTRLAIFASASVALFTGCATTKATANFSRFGEADPSGDRGIVERYISATKAAEPLGDVRVLIDTVPEGIEVKDSAVTVQDGYSHKVIGKFSLVPSGIPFYTLLTFADYESEWLKPYCYWQVPLTWVTLTVWSWLPIAYPCYASGSRSLESWITDAKRLATSAGGDLIVGRYLGTNGESAGGFQGVVIAVDPAMKKAELKTKPIPKAAVPSSI